VFIFLHIGSALLMWLICCVVFWKKRKHGLWTYFLLGWSLQILLSLPAGIWQAVNGWPHISLASSPLWMRILTPLIGWPFNTGGYTVRNMFETTIGHLEWIFGDRTAVVLSNMPYYLLLMAVQASILAFIFAVRYKRKRTFMNWVPISLMILFLANSFANVRWFWAGT